MFPSDVPREDRQKIIIDSLNSDGIAWMRQRDLPEGYVCGFGFGFVAREFDKGDAPVILKGSRSRLFESDRHAVDRIYNRAIKLFRITILETDKVSKKKLAIERTNRFFRFSDLCREKFSKRYPRQRKSFGDLNYSSYLYGRRIELSIDECKKIEYLIDSADLVEQSSMELIKAKRSLHGRMAA